MIWLVLSLATSNEFVLAYSDDGTAALTQLSPGVFRVIGPKATTRFDLAGDKCRTRTGQLEKAVRGFTGVEVAVRGCGRKERDTIVRTLKRHAELATAAELPELPLVEDAIAVAGLKPVKLGRIKPVRAALSPTRRLLLVFTKRDGGAEVALAARFDKDGNASSIALE